LVIADSRQHGRSLFSQKQVLFAQIVDRLLYAAVAMLIVTGDIQAWHIYATSIGRRPSNIPAAFPGFSDFGCGAARISD
jgi:hypothetical protein